MSEAKVLVRRARPEDMDTLMGLAKSFHYAARAKRFINFEDNVKGWEHWLTRCMTEKGFCVLLLEEKEGGDIPGFVSGMISPIYFAPFDTLLAYETGLWVNQEKRGKGYGKVLIAAFSGWAKKLGCSHVIFASNRGFGWKKVAKLYRAMGFVKEDETFIRRL